MGLGNFRFRIILILVTIAIFVFWLKLSTLHPIILRIYTQDEVPKSVELAEIQKGDDEKVLVTVYYECLCPDSRSFFAKQLLPTFQRLPQNMIIQFVPYGNAKTIKEGDNYTFECQHGPPECKGNMIHACSIEFIKSQDQLLNYLTCMIQSNLDPTESMKQCAEKMQIKYDEIEECAKSQKGRDLLARYGSMTDNLEPKVTFIPTITLDKVTGNQASILKNLLKQVCLKLKNLPKGCE